MLFYDSDSELEIESQTLCIDQGQPSIKISATEAMLLKPVKVGLDIEPGRGALTSLDYGLPKLSLLKAWLGWLDGLEPGLQTTSAMTA